MNAEPFGYRSTVPGDESTPPVPTDALTSEEETVNAARLALEAAIDAGEEARIELAALRKRCPHHVFKDESGWPTYTRVCLACGRFMGFV